MALRRVAVRMAWLLASLLLASLLIFAATNALPGDIAQVILGTNASPGEAERLRAELGLDRPFLTRYLEWLWGAVRFDFGVSYISGRPIAPLIAARLERLGVGWVARLGLDAESHQLAGTPHGGRHEPATGGAGDLGRTQLVLRGRHLGLHRLGLSQDLVDVEVLHGVLSGGFVVDDLGVQHGAQQRLGIVVGGADLGVVDGRQVVGIGLIGSRRPTRCDGGAGLVEPSRR